MNRHGKRVVDRVESGKNLRLDLGYRGSEIRAGISQVRGGAAQPFWVGPIELDAMTGRGHWEAVQSRHSPSRAADRFGCAFGIGFPDYWLQTDGLDFLLHKDPFIG